MEGVKEKVATAVVEAVAPLKMATVGNALGRVRAEE